MNHFQVKGLKELRRALEGLPRRLPSRVLAPAVRAGLAPIAAELRRDVPRDTGALAATIQVHDSPRHGPNGAAAEVQVGGDFASVVTYVAPVNFGSKDQRGQHFAERAFNATRDRAAETCVRKILDGVERELER